MANPLFNAIMGGSKPVGQAQPEEYQPGNESAQTANNAPQMGFQDAMRELQAHPSQMMKQAGFNVPEEIANNPQASVMHLIQSGQVGGPMMRMIQPMLSRLMVRR